MSLCARKEADAHDHARAMRAWRRGLPSAPPETLRPALTPAERDAAQEVVLAHWLTLDASHRNERLEHERRRQGVASPSTPTYPIRVAQTLTYLGQTHTLREWAAITGWNEWTLGRRVHDGWPLEKLLTPKPQSQKAVA